MGANASVHSKCPVPAGSSRRCADDLRQHRKQRGTENEVFRHAALYWHEHPPGQTVCTPGSLELVQNSDPDRPCLRNCFLVGAVRRPALPCRRGVYGYSSLRSQPAGDHQRHYDRSPCRPLGRGRSGKTCRERISGRRGIGEHGNCTADIRQGTHGTLQNRNGSRYPSRCFSEKKPASDDGFIRPQYYPVPEFRAVGDIDLLVRPDDFFRAKDVLIGCGFDELYPNTPVDRHLNLVKDQVHIELHRRFASEYVIDDPRAFDEMLFSDITLEHYKLQEPSNGLVLLEHIAQHLNAGIGLRQIIDWMLFVRSYLDDDTWESEFKSLVEKNGLKELAISLTHMCQIYLGLPENSINWCNDADESLCHELMEYILCCGNFGNSRNTFDSGVITQIPSIRHPIQLFRYVQKHGKDNWVTCQKYPVLKPFAWIYQSLKYIGMSREENADGRKIREMYKEAKKRKNMLMKLGIHAKYN